MAVLKKQSHLLERVLALNHSLSFDRDQRPIQRVVPSGYYPLDHHPLRTDPTIRATSLTDFSPATIRQENAHSPAVAVSRQVPLQDQLRLPVFVSNQMPSETPAVIP